MLYSKSFLHRSSDQWVVFVHGAGGSSSIWHKQLKDFCERHNVLVLDLRGHGKSQKVNTDTKNYSFELIASDVIALLEQKGIQQAHFVGVSLGSIVIKSLRAQRPDLVKSMIFAEPSPNSTCARVSYCGWAEFSTVSCPRCPCIS